MTWKIDGLQRELLSLMSGCLYFAAYASKVTSATLHFNTLFRGIMLNSNEVRSAKNGKLRRGRELTFVTCIYVYIYSKYIDIHVCK